MIGDRDVHDRPRPHHLEQVPEQREDGDDRDRERERELAALVARAARSRSSRAPRGSSRAGSRGCWSPWNSSSDASPTITVASTVVASRPSFRQMSASTAMPTPVMTRVVRSASVGGPAMPSSGRGGPPVGTVHPGGAGRAGRGRPAAAAADADAGAGPCILAAGLRPRGRRPCRRPRGRRRARRRLVLVVAEARPSTSWSSWAQSPTPVRKRGPPAVLAAAAERVEALLAGQVDRLGLGEEQRDLAGRRLAPVRQRRRRIPPRPPRPPSSRRPSRPRRPPRGRRPPTGRSRRSPRRPPRRRSSSASSLHVDRRSVGWRSGLVLTDVVVRLGIVRSEPRRLVRPVVGVAAIGVVARRPPRTRPSRLRDHVGGVVVSGSAGTAADGRRVGIRAGRDVAVAGVLVAQAACRPCRRPSRPGPLRPRGSGLLRVAVRDGVAAGCSRSRLRVRRRAGRSLPSSGGPVGPG